MDLYTSLVRLKMELNDGTMPPMTELTTRASDGGFPGRWQRQGRTPLAQRCTT